MKADNIKHLADMIAKHDLNDIERLLRVTSISLKNKTEKGAMLEDDAVHDLKNQQRLLTTAHEFLTRQTIADVNWRHSFACFQQLTDWYDSANHIENHKQLSMLSWYLQLDKILSSKIPANDVIVLGAAYLGEPNKFAAFLYWLLEHNISPRKIDDSKILHQYFAYHICDISVLHQTYNLLSNLSEKASGFLEYANTTPSQMRGFVNQEQEDSTLRSYNIRGEFFSHHFNFGVVSENTLKKLGCHFNFQDMHTNLFHLFGWEFINALNFNVDQHCVAFKQLIVSSSRQKILEDLPRYILSGQFSPEVGRMMLSTIGSVMPITINPNHENALFKLIKLEPFYIHTVQQADIIHFRLLFKNSIRILCDDVKYKNINHLPYLVSLLEKLTNEREDRSFQHAVVLNSIFKLVLQCGNALRDDEFELIMPIIRQLYPQIRQRMNVYSKNINGAIRALSNHGIDYDAVLHLWGSQLSHVNLFQRMYASFFQKYAYPFTIYQLHAKILQDNYERCALENRPFELNTILSVISTDPDQRIRIMQETLCSNFISEPLIEAILNLAVALNIIEQCVMQSFGDERTVFYYAYTSRNDVLRRALSRKRPIDEKIMMDIINTAIEHHDFLGLDRIWPLIQFTASIRNQTIVLLFNQLNTVLRTFTDSEGYLSKLYKLLITGPTHELSRDNIISIFRLGVQYSALDLLSATCRITGETELLKSEIKIAIEQAADRAQWGVLGLLCGLETDLTLNPRIIQRGNIRLYFRMVERHSKNKGETDMTSPLNYINENEETLLHIAANHCKFQIFRECFQTLKDSLPDHDFKKILNMTTASGEVLKCYEEMPDKKNINDYIEIKRNHYNAANQHAFYASHCRRKRNDEDITVDELESGTSMASLP